MINLCRTHVILTRTHQLAPPQLSWFRAIFCPVITQVSMWMCVRLTFILIWRGVVDHIFHYSPPYHHPLPLHSYMNNFWHRKKVKSSSISSHPNMCVCACVFVCFSQEVLVLFVLYFYSGRTHQLAPQQHLLVSSHLLFIEYVSVCSSHFHSDMEGEWWILNLRAISFFIAKK